MSPLTETLPTSRQEQRAHGDMGKMGRRLSLELVTPVIAATLTVDCTEIHVFKVLVHLKEMR